MARGRPKGATAARTREKEIAAHLIDLLARYETSELRWQIRRYATDLRDGGMDG